MKLVVLEGHAVNPGDLSWDFLKEFGTLTVYDNTVPAAAAARIGDAEIALVNKLAFTEELMDACPQLLYIGVQATGYNNIDLKAATKRGITVCNVPAYSTASVVQHTFALLLELCMHTGMHNASVREGKWSRSQYFTYWDAPLTELSDKTMGLVGYGSIGSAVARVAVALGMQVLASTARPRTDAGQEGVRLCSLEEIFEQADIISLHCPLKPENAGLISAENIAKMKDGAIILNTARGGLVCEKAVAEALHSGKLGGFGADVLAEEPPVGGSPLFTAPNCVITPHIAWAPIESRKRLLAVVAENIRLFLQGTPQNKVNE